jgi:hypothetical protein
MCPLARNGCAAWEYVAPDDVHRRCTALLPVLFFDGIQGPPSRHGRRHTHLSPLQNCAVVISPCPNTPLRAGHRSVAPRSSPLHRNRPQGGRDSHPTPYQQVRDAGTLPDLLRDWRSRSFRQFWKTGVGRSAQSEDAHCHHGPGPGGPLQLPRFSLVASLTGECVSQVTRQHSKVWILKAHEQFFFTQFLRLQTQHLQHHGLENQLVGASIHSAAKPEPGDMVRRTSTSRCLASGTADRVGHGVFTC